MPSDYGLPRGPLRWERAAKNAAKNPDSKNAKLYESRREFARQATDTVHARRIIDATRPVHHYTGGRFNKKPEFWTCSLEHALLQLTIDVHGLLDGTRSAEEVVCSSGYEAPLLGRYAMLGELPTRTVRCQVCGAGIDSGGLSGAPTVDLDPPRVLPKLDELAKAPLPWDAPEATDIERKTYALIDGEWVQIESMLVVDFTPRELQIAVAAQGEQAREEILALLGRPVTL